MEGKTLKEIILNDGGLKGKIFVDNAEHATWKSFGHITQGRSPAFGIPYEILEIKNYASFNPNMHRTTMVIKYIPSFSEPVEVYLDEQLNDIMLNEAEFLKAGQTAAVAEKRIGRY